jgi:hypothetical protein
LLHGRLRQHLPVVELALRRLVVVHALACLVVELLRHGEQRRARARIGGRMRQRPALRCGLFQLVFCPPRTKAFRRWQSRCAREPGFGECASTGAPPL